MKMRKGVRKNLVGCYLNDVEKARLQEIADMVFEGNVSDVLRWMIHSSTSNISKKDMIAWRKAQLEAEIQYLTAMDT